MATFWKTSSDTWVNSEKVRLVSRTAGPTSGTYVLRVIVDSDGSGQDLAGVYASEADAIEAAAKLTQGFDPATLVP